MFTWIKPSMVIQPILMVYCISIIVIHIFILLMPKICKVDNDSATYLWHCHLGHIGVKRIKKLHAYWLLESLDYESFDTCELCLMGKMTKTPFSGTMKWANDLLEIIHTDVCGPMSVEARGGYRYFLTFTNDLSRYGYIYLMKHKSKTFEKFKEFQSEVENHRKENNVSTVWSWRCIFELRAWPSFKTMWNSFTTHATWKTTA